MQVQNYGGFTASLPAIDVRFGRPEHVDHFVEAWLRPGTVPPLPAEGALRVELMSIGTILEHELRHFHDYLICYESLEASWIRRQMLLNGMPAVTRILKSPAHDVIPFPLMAWAELTDRARAKQIAELQHLFPAGCRRFWAPKTLRTSVIMPRKQAAKGELTSAQDRKFTSMALEAVRAFRVQLDPLRHGLDPTPLAQGRFTPRFVHEFSALITQVVAVAKTYGSREAIEFMAMLEEDSSSYSRFFVRMLHLFGSYGREGNFDPARIDFQNMQTAAFWAMAGCPQDGKKAGPATRLSTLVDAAEDDWDNVFPPGADTLEILDNLDERMGCTPYRKSLDLTQAHMEEQCATTLRILRSLAGAGETHTRGAELFESVMKCRATLVAAIKADPTRYVDPAAWMLDLSAWPQCPVHLRFSSARMGLDKRVLSWCGPDAIFNVTTNMKSPHEDGYVGDVYMPTFFGGPAVIPIEPVIATQRLMLMLDLLLEPEQVGVVDENAARTFIAENFGKELVRLL